MTKARIERMSIDGGELHCEIAGDKDAPSIVFVHGFGLDRRLWDEQWDVFAKRYQVVRYDLRGFGRSTDPVVDKTYSHVDDLLKLMDKLKIKQTTLIGLSMGGSVALEFAAAHPDRVNALVLAGAVASGIETPELDKQTVPVWRTGRSEGVVQARVQWLKTPMLRLFNDVPEASMLLRQMVGDYRGFHWQQRDPAGAAGESIVPRLRSISAPTLVLIGDRDLPDLRVLAQVLSAGIPDATLVSVPGAGHVLPLDDPRKFNQFVQTFLKQHGIRPARA